MKVIENKDCRVTAVTMQGIVIAEYSGVIMQIDQSVIKRAADELGLTNTTVVRDPDDVEKLETQLESALATCKQADETIKNLKSSLADRQAIVSKHLRKIEEQEKLLKEKDITINSLREDIAFGNKLINELEFQRNAAKDSVVQLEKQLNEALAKLDEQQNHKDELLNSLNAVIEDKDKTISEFSQEIENLSNVIQKYEYGNKYIKRYSLVNDDTTIFDNSFEYEPIVCADAKTARNAIKELLDGAEWSTIYNACDTSAYKINFYSDYTEIVNIVMKSAIKIKNNVIANNLYMLLKCEYIDMSDICKLVTDEAC